MGKSGYTTARIGKYHLSPDDVYKFDTESQRQRYHVLIEELRCPKCQNQNLAGSDSEIASDLRRELYRLLLEGKTDREIKTFMVERYGDFVLYKPRFQASTALLWLLPVGLFVIGALALVVIVRSRRQRMIKSSEDTVALSNTQKQKLDELLNK